MGEAPSDVAGPSLWWRHERFHRLVLQDPERLFPLFCDERDAIEASWAKDPPDSAQAFAEHGRILDLWMDKAARAFVQDVRPVWVRRYWARRSRRAGL